MIKVDEFHETFYRHYYKGNVTVSFTLTRDLFNHLLFSVLRLRKTIVLRFHIIGTCPILRQIFHIHVYALVATLEKRSQFLKRQPLLQ